MIFKIADKVRIKPMEWYNDNKDDLGLIYISQEDAGFRFGKQMSRYCGMTATILYAKYIEHFGYVYRINLDKGLHIWSEEMFDLK